MKQKNLEQLIKREMASVTPDILDQIKLSEIEIIPPQEPEKRVVHRKVWQLSAATFAAASLVFLIVFMLFINRTTPISERMVFTTKEDIVTMSAITAASLLHQSDKSASLRESWTHINRSDGLGMINQQDLIPDHIETLNWHLHVFEPVLTGKSTMRITLGESSLEDYSRVVTYDTMDLRYQSIQFTMHYNETSLSRNRDQIDGIVIIEGIHYLIEGETMQSSNNIQVDFTVRHPDNPENYLNVTHHQNQENQTFGYTIYLEDTLQFSSQLTIERIEEDLAINIAYETPLANVTFDVVKKTAGFSNFLFIDYNFDTSLGKEEGIIVVLVVLDTASNNTLYRYVVNTEHKVYTIDKARVMPITFS